MTAQFKAGDQRLRDFLARVVRRSSAGHLARLCGRAEKYTFFLLEQPSLDKIKKYIAGRKVFFQLWPGNSGTWAVPSPADAFPIGSYPMAGQKSLSRGRKKQEECHGVTAFQIAC